MRKRTLHKTAAALTALALCAGVLTGCGGAASSTAASSTASSAAASSEVSSEEADELAAKNVADLIDAIYVQERTDDTDAQCAAAKAAWDALTDAQKELVEGEEADPDYFGRDTGDASKDDPRNADDIGENELLVVSFGTSFNASRAADIKGIEDALQACPGPRRREDRQHAAGHGPRCGQRREESGRPAHPPDARCRVRRDDGDDRQLPRQVRVRRSGRAPAG